MGAVVSAHLSLLLHVVWLHAAVGAAPMTLQTWLKSAELQDLDAFVSSFPHAASAELGRGFVRGVKRMERAIMKFPCSLRGLLAPGLSEVVKALAQTHDDMEALVHLLTRMWLKESQKQDIADNQATNEEDCTSVWTLDTTVGHFSHIFQLGAVVFNRTSVEIRASVEMLSSKTLQVLKTALLPDLLKFSPQASNETQIRDLIRIHQTICDDKCPKTNRTFASLLWQSTNHLFNQLLEVNRSAENYVEAADHFLTTYNSARQRTAHEMECARNFTLPLPRMIDKTDLAQVAEAMAAYSKQALPCVQNHTLALQAMLLRTVEVYSTYLEEANPKDLDTWSEHRLPGLISVIRKEAKLLAERLALERSMTDEQFVKKWLTDHPPSYDRAIIVEQSCVEVDPSVARPVVMKGFAEKIWPIPSEAAFEKVLQACGNMEVPVYQNSPTSQGEAQSGSHESLSTFLQRPGLREGSPSSSYVWDLPLSRSCPELLKNMSIPAPFAAADPALPLYSNHPSLFIGGNGSRTALHQDVQRTNFWQSLVVGRKSWTFYAMKRHLQLLMLYGTSMYDPLLIDTGLSDEIMRRLYERYPLLWLADTWFARQVSLEAGDVIFVPWDLAHAVVNEGVTLAFSMNYVDGSNLEQHLQYLCARMRDREEPYKRFIARVLQHPPLVANSSIEDKPFSAYFSQQEAAQSLESRLILVNHTAC
mmetsp:Transcript_65350/g.115957  ORF Transcript_65350/g.115957 Transcript_65350/m.115957 type:complete len:703 (-) Transcript_65350:63-2171(-)